MKRMLLLVLLLAPSLASAQNFIRYYPPASGGTWDGGAFTDPAEGATGCAAPGYSFTDDTNAGLCLIGANEVRVQMAPSGASMSYFRVASTLAQMISMDAASNATSVSTDDNVIDFDADSVDILRLTSALGTGFISANGATAATARSIAAGTGISVANGSGVAGNPTVSVDTAVVNTFTSGTGDVSATGAVGTFYAETDANSFYTYPSTDTEHWVLSIAAGQTAGRLFQTSGTDVLTEITPTDETVLVSNGTTWEKKTLPDCDDSGGNHLNYDTGTNAFSCGTSGGSAAFDPGTTFELYEEFAGGNFATAFMGGNQGQGAFSAGAGTSGNSVAYIDLNNKNLHGIELISGITDNTGEQLWFGLSNAAVDPNLAMWLTDPTSWNLDTVVKVGTTSDLTESAIFFGLGSNSFAGNGFAATQTGGVYIVRDTDHSHTNFVFVICDSSTTGCGSAGDATNQDSEASTIAISDNTFYRLRIRYSSTEGPGSTKLIGFRVNDETEVTFCSSGCSSTMANLPTSGTLTPAIAQLARGTTSKGLGIDYLYMRINGMDKY